MRGMCTRLSKSITIRGQRESSGLLIAFTLLAAEPTNAAMGIDPPLHGSAISMWR